MEQPSFLQRLGAFSGFGATLLQLLAWPYMAANVWVGVLAKPEVFIFVQKGLFLLMAAIVVSLILEKGLLGLLESKLLMIFLFAVLAAFAGINAGIIADQTGVWFRIFAIAAALAEGALFVHIQMRFHGPEQ